MSKSASGAIPIGSRDKGDGWVPNPRDLSTTPGGTIYATTPGGTKIMYNRDALLMLSKSPLSKTPTQLPVIPGVTAPDGPATGEIPKGQKQQPKLKSSGTDEMFELEQ
eukprot:TRINITY_DN1630_c0_g1_i2.p1 TRINITY_DN1630_c0_g1~~TRINITY_DN1630_c0_g1_i2.p1  ORF type:complete len:108 (-),score=9.86 TRINITY_DN1630_c0_g1_i2:26-349(-)